MANYDPRCEGWFSLHPRGGGTMSWREIGEKYGETRDTVKNATLRWVKMNGERAATVNDGSESDTPNEAFPVHMSGVEVKGEIVFEDKKPGATDGDVQALLDAYLNVIEKAKPVSNRQREAAVRFRGNLPIGMNFFGDGHIGSWGWAAKRQLEDLHLTATTDGLFPSFMGDEWDNFIFGFGKWASAMPPGHQRKIGHYMFRRIFPKTVSVVGGNHLDWTKKVADIDLNAELAEKSNAVFLGSRGELTAKVGNESYSFLLQHRARGASTVNKTNSARVALNDVGGKDVYVEADRHDPWAETVYHNGMRQTRLRTGTYKIDDTYPDEIGFEQGKWDMPMVILLPDRHRVISFLDFRDGIDTLTFLREKYRTGRIISA